MPLTFLPVTFLPLGFLPHTCQTHGPLTIKTRSILVILRPIDPYFMETLRPLLHFNSNVWHIIINTVFFISSTIYCFSIHRTKVKTLLLLVKMAEKCFLFQFLSYGIKCLMSSYHLRCTCLSSK